MDFTIKSGDFPSSFDRMFDPPFGHWPRKKTQRQGLAVSAGSWVPWMPCPARAQRVAGLGFSGLCWKQKVRNHGG